MAAQAKMNEYFTSKKRNDAAHASKRRKIEIPFSSVRTRSKSDDGKKSPATNPVVPSDSESDVERDNFTGQTFPNSANSKKIVPIAKSVRSKRGNNLKSPLYRSRNKIKAAPSVKPQVGQKKLTDLFNLSNVSLSSNSNASSESQSSDSNDKDVNEKDSKDEDYSEQQTLVTEDITSFWDNHDANQQGTPRKRTVSTVDVAIEGQHTRRRKVPVRKQSPTKTQDLTSDSARKKLDLVSSLEPGPSKSDDEVADEADNEVSDVMMSKTHLLSLVSEIILPHDNAISPLPATPERPEEVSPSPEPVVAVPPKLQNLSQKLKALSKMNGQALKNRLKQSGKICDIKEKLGDLNKAITEAKVQATASEGSCVQDSETEDLEKVLPAYQRFDTLVEEGPPALSLPFSYRVLEGSFQAMDTVVSMMHNRSEMCTFSKLRAAVQNMTKKNFEEKTVGQIKTIAPNAYTFRQESNIPTFGKKISGYQLTVEANLQKDGSKSNSEGPRTSDGRSTFTASMLVKRKHSFRNGLLNYLKQLHKTFLSSLKPPVIVPDDKLTRWHPHFQLDKVPEVVVSPLPQPPEIRVYHSAKDVLEKQRGRLNPRVEVALSKVAAMAEGGDSQSSGTCLENVSPSTSSTLVSVVPSTSPDTSSMKGIPPALLAKIRAKEAQRMEEALTRSPSEDHKTKMMSHLPEIIRILRTYFVTEKKPALPLEAVYKKLEDSYHTGISQREVEQHIDILKELAPELVSVVEIKRGKFLKLDKNVDVQAVSNRILNLVKSRK